MDEVVRAIASALEEGGEFGISDVERIDESEDIGFVHNGTEYFVTIERA